MLQIDVKQANLAAEATFAAKEYIESFEGEELVHGFNDIREYNGEYFDTESSLDFAIHIGAEHLPEQADGLTVIDYKGDRLIADIDTYVRKGVAFQSDEVKEFLQEIGAHEVSEDE
jgi:hypothetical protein